MSAGRAAPASSPFPAPTRQRPVPGSQRQAVPHAVPEAVASAEARAADKAIAARTLRAAAAGDAAAWDALVRRYSGLLWAVARGYRLGDADSCDVIQTVWLLLLQHAGDLRRPEEVGAWLSTTARRECLRSLRIRSRELPVDDESALEPAEGPQDPVGSAATRPARDAALWAAVHQLPDRQRQVLVALMADPPLSYAEVSLAVRIPVGAIGPTRARALGRLRAMPALAAMLDATPTSPAV